MKEFDESVDPELLVLAKKYRANKNETFKRYTISKVSDKEKNIIYNLTGIDVSGFSHAINKNGINHIERRHGKNGEHDNSMADLKNVSRIGYVLSNFDTIKRTLDQSGQPAFSNEYRDNNNKPAKLITYSKKIDGTIYVVEAVADSSYKKLWVETAYISKNKEGITQASDAKALQTAAKTTPHDYVQNELVSLPSDNIIAQKSENVNGEPTFSEKVDRFTPDDLDIRETQSVTYSSGSSNYEYEAVNVKNVKDAALKSSFEKAVSLGKLFGHDIEVFRGSIVENGNMMANRDGAFISGGKILINENAKHPVAVVLGHELLHAMKAKDTRLVKRFEKLVAQTVKANDSEGKAFKNILNEYKNAGEELSEADVNEEICAIFAGNAFANVDVAQYIATHDRTLGEFFYDFVQKIKNLLSGKHMQAEKQKLDKIEKALMDALVKYRRVGGNDGGFRGSKNLFAGRNSNTANFSALDNAIKLLEVGKTSMNDIRKQTGWFRGLDGMWRFELDDKEVSFSRGGLFSGGYKNNKKVLENYIQHTELFKAYPQLRTLSVEMKELPKSYRGAFVRETFDDSNIALNHPPFIEVNNKMTGEETKATLLHEIQHAIQYIEGFASGASPEWWDGMKNKMTTYEKERLSAAKNKIRAAGEDIGRKYGANAQLNAYNYGKVMQSYLENSQTENTDSTIERIEAEAVKDGYFEELQEFSNAFTEPFFIQEEVEARQKRGSLGLYLSTAGEIEARDAAARLFMTADERKATEPNVRKHKSDVVFTGEKVAGFEIVNDKEALSIKEILKENIDILKKMKPLINKPFSVNVKNTGDAIKVIDEYFKKIGSEVDREGFGRVIIDRERIKKGFSYLNTKNNTSNPEIEAFSLVAKIIKQGTEVNYRKNHKGRPYDSKVHFHI